MLVFGPISSLFDLLTFGVLLLAVGANEQEFQTGWFIECLFTQVLVILVIRTRLRVEFVKRRFEPRAEPARVISAAEPPAERSGQ